MPYEQIRGFRKLYADSSVFLAVIKKEAVPCSNGMMRWEVAANIMQDAEHGRIQLWTSTITIAEVRRIRGIDTELAQSELEVVSGFFRNPYINMASVTRAIAEHAQILGAQYDSWPMDAIHLATAVYLQCDALIAWDKRLTTRFQAEPVQGVTVIEP